MYLLDNGTYPSTEQGLAALLEPPEIPPVPNSWHGPYLRKSTSLKDPWGQAYVYQSPGKHNPDDYDLYSFGPDQQEGGGDDIHNWEQDETNGL